MMISLKQVGSSGGEDGEMVLRWLNTVLWAVCEYVTCQIKERERLQLTS